MQAHFSFLPEAGKSLEIVHLAWLPIAFKEYDFEELENIYMLSISEAKGNPRELA